MRGFDAGHPQVLPKGARRQLPAQGAGPEIGVGLGVRVDRLVLPAVVRPVGLDIPAQAQPVDRHRTVRRTLVDGRNANVSLVPEELVDTADGEDRT